MNVLGNESDCEEDKTSDRTAVRVPASVAPVPSRPVPGDALQQRIEKADAILQALSAWGAQGVLDPIYISMQKQRIVQGLIDRELGDEGYG